MRAESLFFLALSVAAFTADVPFRGAKRALLQADAAAEKPPSCSQACGNAIQLGQNIVCYCIPQCLTGSPGPCCDDFAEVCPAEAGAGKSMLSSPAASTPMTYPKLPEGCKAPESTVIPIPDTTIVFEEVGKSCKGHCSAAMTDASGTAVCYCDAGCLLTADCCPDFVDVCEVDPCITAIVQPAPSVPVGGSCKNACGQLVQVDGFQLCSCEVNCVLAGSCCADFLQVCEVPEDVYPVVSPTSCLQKCGGSAGKCFCDYQCVEKGDCCADYTKVCGTTATFPSQINSGLGSCKGKCGGAGIDCWCDDRCLAVGDCCWDYLAECK